ncbi:MAG: hypothetical protein A2148_02375 [Chloroflexi bacterium RBG_16_68_14]|nr:MAG: hypothetical protein A2148_02375 [Chloroflexi bacterium RBG_16_68_14]
MAKHPNVELLKRAYEAFAKGDLATLREVASEEGVWHVPGSGPLADEYRGWDEVVTLFTRSAQMTGGTERIEVHDVLANDEHGVALTRYTASREGNQLDMRIVNVFHLKDGKITEVWDFMEDLRVYDEFWS